MIGPFRGGRSIAVAGSQSRPKEYYFGATGGGLWKTTDSGANWNCVSDGFFSTSSVGAVAVSVSNPDVVYAGTGERDIRGNISVGDGLYKSTDGGATWAHAGLAETQTIAKIAIDPKNPDVVYAAALGHVYGSGPDRGLYKTTDGGKTWSKVLAGTNDHTGAEDVALDPSDSQTIYAALWEAFRTPYSLSSGGPGSKLMKSTDGGATWSDLTSKPGMPTGIVGKIGISVSPVNPKRVWALVESADGGVYRSDDAGATWTRTTEEHELRQRAFYFNHIFADTQDADAVYVLNVGAYKSTDAGKTFRGFSVNGGDNHDLWIAPDNPKRMIESNDGGASVTSDGGVRWSAQDMPTGQYYHVSADTFEPYRLYAAQQDSGAVRIASRGAGGGITSKDLTGTAGGESGYVVAKPNDPDIAIGGSYGGDIEMVNDRTGERRSIDPWPDNPMGSGAKDAGERFQWTFPIGFSPNDPNLLYTASQYLYRSSNLGQTWVRMSPDLTRHDPKTLESSGGPITKDNTSVEYYATIFAYAESPKRRGTIWTGSDDGLVSLTTNNGGSWSGVTPKEMPHWGRVSIVEASPFDARRAYLAVDNHQNDDQAPYFFRTRDSGKSWTKIVSGLPMGAFARVIR